MILRRNFLRSTLLAPFLAFFNAIKSKPLASLEIPEPPYPYAFGETYSEASIELQVCIDPHGEGWHSVPWFKVGEIMHVQVGEFDVFPADYRHLRMIVKNVDLKGGVITLAGLDDGKDAKQLDPYGGKHWGMDEREAILSGTVHWSEEI
jgi:hypothetical protein